MRLTLSYPTTYAASHQTIVVHDDSGQIAIATGRRTGMAAELNGAPVYRLAGIGRPSLDGRLFALTEAGLVEYAAVAPLPAGGD